LRRLLRDKAADLVLAFIVAAAACAPWVAPYDPYRIDLDANGRDILSRVIFDARNTLLVGLTGVAVGDCWTR
jgi:ABC-type dipeptide/oligopeptide/nickel transport system permease subunit